MNIRLVFLLLAIVGGIVPVLFFGQHFASVGFGLMDFVAALFENPASGGFTADLLISSFVFWIAMFHRRSRGKGPKPLLFIVLNLFIGLSCALPAYIYASLGGNAGSDAA
ncbi:MAG: DUF2834 domain-containing protein [Gammaproteobacteria bacterium]|nr:DUF2834 domain-containing protein [Gammaproteobacteria bacterium]MDH4314643.1 DUF2834 domain-containing protein [Gammaproteobacteria bacterium]MDH5212879.1 DUF2834 domain-containing protein [Gammaproteobacteria bacterium]